jgi:phage terminase large subunit-like protein
MSKDFKLLEVAYDRWGADKLVTELEETDGITMVMHGQGYKDMNPPMKHLFDWVTDEKLAHNNHAPMRWCADNLAVEIDGAENVKPRKDQSSDRIDLVVALVMALGRAIKNFEKTSKYEDPKSEGLTLL